MSNKARRRKSVVIVNANTSFKFMVCYRKKRYLTRETADDQARLAREARPYSTRALHAYPCDICHGWHIGKGAMTRTE